MGLTESRRKIDDDDDQIGGDENSGDRRGGDESIRSSATNQSTTTIMATNTSGSSTNRRFRMLIPRRKSSSKKSDASSNAITDSSSSSSKSNPSPSPIVASFMTNISSRCNPTTPVMLGGNNNSDLTTSRSISENTSSSMFENSGSSMASSGLKWPISLRKRERNRRLAAAVDIPSPVPSLDEPPEENLEEENVVQQTFGDQHQPMESKSKIKSMAEEERPSANLHHQHSSPSVFRSCVARSTGSTTTASSDANDESCGEIEEEIAPTARVHWSPSTMSKKESTTNGMDHRSIDESPVDRFGQATSSSIGMDRSLEARSLGEIDQPSNLAARLDGIPAIESEDGLSTIEIGPSNPATSTRTNQADQSLSAGTVRLCQPSGTRINRSIESSPVHTNRQGTSSIGICRLDQPSSTAVNHPSSSVADQSAKSIEIDRESTTRTIAECHGSPGSVVRSQSMMSEPKESRLRRPDTLIGNSKLPASRSAWAKLGMAPLAESECFVIENSPAVEFPPTVRGKLKSPSKDCGRPRKDGATADCKAKKEESIGGSSAETYQQSNRFQSRLRNPTTYASRQRAIYSRYSNAPPGPTSTENRSDGRTNGQKDDEKRSDRSTNGRSEDIGDRLDGRSNGRELDDHRPNEQESKKPAAEGTRSQSTSDSLIMNTTGSSAFDSTDASIVSSPPTHRHTDGRLSNLSPILMAKRELHDSGVKMDSIYGSEAMSGGGVGNGGNGGGTCASPDGSLYRGMIDDEIRDQPGLTISGGLERSIDDELTKDRSGGPVRIHQSKLPRRRASNRASQQLHESYESTVSSLSIDSEDLMLDFDGGDLMVEEAADTIGGNGTTTAYCASSLGRRSSRNGGGATTTTAASAVTTTGSWGRRKTKAINLASNGKRASMEAVMDEWSSLKGELEINGSRQRALSDLQQSTSTTTTMNGRPLKPPASLIMDDGEVSSIDLEQQTYRHVIQDVTVMKTLLLRLRRVLQEAETSNPFENSINGLSKLYQSTGVLEQDKKAECIDRNGAGGQQQPPVEALKEENSALRNQVVIMQQQVEDQNRQIQCLQYQLKQCRQRSLRRSESALDDSLPDVDSKSTAIVRT